MMLTQSISYADEDQSADGVLPAQSDHRIRVLGRGEPGRAAAEAFVRDRFRETHGARIETFMPSLLAMNDRPGALCAVAGWRRAHDSDLFLERYLTQPIEVAIAAARGREIGRAEVVEVGNFACTNAATARAFMGALSFFLLDRHFCWIAFTATRRIRRMLEQMSIGCLDLGPADDACVTSCVDDWGRYYRTEPHVMAGYLPMARCIPELRAAYAD